MSARRPRQWKMKERGAAKAAAEPHAPAATIINTKMTSTNPPNANSNAGGSRLNAHVFLGLSFLLLSAANANARPLDASAEVNMGSLLAGSQPTVSGGISEQIAHSFLKLLNLKNENSQHVSEQSILSHIEPSGQEEAMVLPEPSPASSEMKPAPDEEPKIPLSPGTLSPLLHDPTEFIESILHNNPALSFAVGVSNLMHKMKELFVDIAIMEGEERGIFVAKPESPTPVDLDRIDNGDGAEGLGALGLELLTEEQTQSVQTSPPTLDVEDDVSLFDLEISNEDERGPAVPGRFMTDDEPVEEASERYLGGVDSRFNPHINPYAALSISSVLATLFVVGIIAGRHYYRAQKERDVYDALERGDQGGSDNGGDEEINEKVEITPAIANETTDSEEINEKVSLALEVSISENSTVQPPTEDEKAMALLVDVANAALASSPNLVARPVLLDTQPVPSKVNDVLGEMWDEISKELRAKKLVRGTLSRSSTPPPTVSISRAECEDEDSIVEKIRMPKHLAIPIQRARSPLYQRLLPSETALSECVAGSPAMSYVTAQISPATSFTTAIERGSTPLPVEEGRAPIVDLGASPPLPYYSVPSSPRRHHLAAAGATRSASPQPPGALVMYDYENGDEMVRENGAILPPAHITQTALNLALMLPATEWIFQFIVVFIGWFGFWMQPVPSQRRRR
ncbi:hypothetical protein CPB86DRAFT_870973 [Serendipita vermifera]|nr:hypothetical protein CPB86DRAFT_870973 [Serendipita vermifera]